MDVVENILNKKVPACDRCGSTKGPIIPTLLGTTNLCEDCLNKAGDISLY